MAATLDKIARRLRQNQHAHNEDDGPRELDGHRDAVAASIVAILGSIEDNCRNEETDSDGPLIAADNGSSDPFWCAEIRSA